MVSSFCSVWSDDAARKSSTVRSYQTKWQYHLEPCLRKAWDGTIKLLCLIQWVCLQEQPHWLKHNSLSLPSRALRKQGSRWYGSNIYAWTDGAALASSLIGSIIYACSIPFQALPRKAQDGMDQALKWCCSWERHHRLKHKCLIDTVSSLA